MNETQHPPLQFGSANRAVRALSFSLTNLETRTGTISERRPTTFTYAFLRRNVVVAYRFENFSIRPAVSTNFCSPVKKGWQAAQIPMRKSFRVERVK